MTTLYIPTRRRLPEANAASTNGQPVQPGDTHLFQRALEKKQSQHHRENNPLTSSKALVPDRLNGQSVAHRNTDKATPQPSLLQDKKAENKSVVQARNILNVIHEGDDKRALLKDKLQQDLLEKSDATALQDNSLIENSVAYMHRYEQEGAVDPDQSSEGSATLQAIEQAREQLLSSSTTSGHITAPTSVNTISLDSFIAVFDELNKQFFINPDPSLVKKKWTFTLQDSNLPIANITLSYHGPAGASSAKQRSGQWQIALASSSDDDRQTLERYSEQLQQRLAQHSDVARDAQPDITIA